MIKSPILLKVTYIFNVIPTTIHDSFRRNRKPESNIYMEFQGTLDKQNSTEKNEKVGGFTLYDFKIYYIARVTRMVW